MSKPFNIALVGATGALGGELLHVLEERAFPAATVRLFDSAEHDGDFIDFNDESVIVETLGRDSFAGIDLAFFCTDAERAQEFCPLAVATGALCIDLSGDWRLDRDVPLVVPAVNPEALAAYRNRGIIAIPDPATLQLVTALKPLHTAAGLKRIVVTTFQSVSESGEKAIDELRIESGELLNGRPASPRVFPHQIAFNCLPQVGAFLADGATQAERALIDATRKLLGLPQLGISATTVLVPVFYGSGASLHIETEKPLSAAAARTLLVGAPGCELIDDPAELAYPMPLDSAGQDAVQIGRIREDAGIVNGLALWLCSDNLRQVASSAVQVAELLAARSL